MPAGGRGAGVLLLHAWWGLTPFFTGLCDRLAKEGFVVFAPDLHHGKTANTIEEAEQIMKERDAPAVQEAAVAALDFLRGHEAVISSQMGAVGFSLGTQYALMLDSLAPDALAAIVLYYGFDDLTQTRAAALGHFGETDEWEPIEHVRKLHGRDVTIHVYPETGHWFVEEDRPEHYRPAESNLAWERTLAFLRAKIR